MLERVQRSCGEVVCGEVMEGCGGVERLWGCSREVLEMEKVCADVFGRFWRLQKC